MNDIELDKIIQNYKDNELDKALELLGKVKKENVNQIQNLKIYSLIYFKKKEWKKYLDTCFKLLPQLGLKHEILCNMGVAKFQMGKINESIIFYKNAIKENEYYGLAYENLAISYNEIGMLEAAIENFVKSLKLNPSNIRCKLNLINVLNFITPQNNLNNNILKKNEEIIKLANKFKSNQIYEQANIKKFLDRVDRILIEEDDLFHLDTQIVKKNSNNLNCKRHLKIFEEHEIIPKFCFDCYKVQVIMYNVIDLIKLSFLFNEIYLENNNIRKCMVEIRSKVEGNYKGYIYCNSSLEAQKIKHILENKIRKIGIFKKKIELKHGCSEYYDKYPDYKKINFNKEQEMTYKKKWSKIENIFDNKIPTRENRDLKKYCETTGKVNLSDVLVIKNWINYAKIIGDSSYKLIYNKEISKTFLNQKIANQSELRKIKITN